MQAPGTLVVVLVVAMVVASIARGAFRPACPAALLSAHLGDGKQEGTVEHEANKAIVRRLYEEAFTNSGDLSVIDEFVAEGFIDHAGPPGLPAGREGFRLAVLSWRQAFPDIALRVDALVGQGDMVAVAWTGSGTHQGELMGIAPTGVAGQVVGLSMNRIADGRVVERWGNSDDLGLLQQLGVIPRG
jgi:predicted ester cyclase